MTWPMLPGSPARGMSAVPIGDTDGAVIQHAGRYARECVLTAFEMIGGVDRMAHWAEKNPTEFYTRLFGKVVTREVEIQPGSGIEDLLAALDRSAHSEKPTGPVLDAEVEILDD